MSIAWKRLEEEPSGIPVDTARPAPEIDRSETFVPETPIRSLNDLIVSKAVRNKLEAALNRIQYHDKLYNDWELKKIDPQGRRVAINFFGHPGTGKTFCAEAIAQHLGKRIITVNYAEIESKYVGETPKNITAAFETAKATDSVLFFDEADSILGKRLTNVTQSADHGVNVSRSVMLLQLDKFEGVVIFASNLPENYDGAFVRRILAHIEFELPDLDCRLRLWQYLLPSKVPCAEDVTAEWLAAQSEGLAGGDILNVVKLAASQAVARSGNQCRVFQADLLEAIAQVRDGKAKVGSFAKAPPTMQETTVQPEELAPELRQRYDQVAAKIAEPLPHPS
jgi:SpoVK/Ycf46/Vps4 family AAA+-type ATPase